MYSHKPLCTPPACLNSPSPSAPRRHPPPNEGKLLELQQVSDELGLRLDTSSSAALHASLQDLRDRRPNLGQVRSLGELG